MRSSKTIELLLGRLRSTEATHSRITSAPMPPCVRPLSLGLPSTSIFAEAGWESAVMRLPSRSVKTGRVFSSVKLGFRPSEARQARRTLQQALRDQPLARLVRGLDCEVLAPVALVDREKEQAVLERLVDRGLDLLQPVLQVQEVFVQQRADRPVSPDPGAFSLEEAPEELDLFGTHEVLVRAVSVLEEGQRDAELQVSGEPDQVRLLGWVREAYPAGLRASSPRAPRPRRTWCLGAGRGSGLSLRPRPG